MSSQSPPTPLPGNLPSHDRLLDEPTVTYEGDGNGAAEVDIVAEDGAMRITGLDLTVTLDSPTSPDLTIFDGATTTLTVDGGGEEGEEMYWNGLWLDSEGVEGGDSVQYLLSAFAEESMAGPFGSESRGTGRTSARWKSSIGS